MDLRQQMMERLKGNAQTLKGMVETEPTQPPVVQPKPQPTKTQTAQDAAFQALHSRRTVAKATGTPEENLQQRATQAVPQQHVDTPRSPANAEDTEEENGDEPIDDGQDVADDEDDYDVPMEDQLEPEAADVQDAMSNSRSRVDAAGRTMSLTGREEAYCQNLASGMTKIDAYCAAYDATNMSRKTAGEMASRISKKPHIVRRVEALKASLRRKVYHDREFLRREIIDGTLEIAQDRTAKNSDRLKAYHMLGSLDHVKLWVTRAETTDTTPLEKMTSEELQQKFLELVNSKG